MKIAFLVNEFPSVSETFIRNQITGVIDRGHDVKIIAGKIRGDLRIPDDLKKYNLLKRTITSQIPKNKIFRLWVGLYYVVKFLLKKPLPILQSLNILRFKAKAASLTLLFQIIPFLDDKPYDIIHCQFGCLGLEGLCIKQIMGGETKLVTSFRGYDATKAIHNNSRLYAELFRVGDLFLPVSLSLKERIVAQGCPEDKIVVLPSGIDCERLQYSEKNMSQDKPINVISIARLVEKKGIVYAIEAIARVVECGKNVRYFIVGEGPLRGDLERTIDRLGLSNHVQLLGQRSHSEVIGLLQDAHILIAPSITAKDGDQEGIPNVLKEGMALGLPVVSTLHSGIPELIEAGVSGFLVEEGNVDALADRILYLYNHPETWNRMGKAGRVCVENYFNNNTLNDLLVDLYSTLFIAKTLNFSYETAIAARLHSGER